MSLTKAYEAEDEADDEEDDVAEAAERSAAATRKSAGEPKSMDQVRVSFASSPACLRARWFTVPRGSACHTHCTKAADAPSGCLLRCILLTSCVR